MKNRVKSVFLTHYFISNCNAFSNIKITFYYSVCMRTKKVRIFDEAERVQSVSYLHIRSLSGYIYLMLLSQTN